MPMTNPFKTFNSVFLSLFGATLLLILGVYVYMQPLVGELTRLGGYLENHFGWTQPQEHFEEPLFTRATSVDDYDRRYDVVVIGDSFSDDLSKGWQNYLAAATGWSIITFNMNRIDPKDVLNSPIYQDAPPQLLVYQSVERNLISRFDECPVTAPAFEAAPAPLPTLSLQPMAASIELIGMDRYPRAPVDGIGIDSAFNFLQKAAYRRLLNRNETETHEFALTRSGLFSNAASETLLVITRDFRIHGATPSDIETAKCGLMAFQNRIEQSGRTIFVGLLFPDKTSIYGPYIADPDYVNASIVDAFTTQDGLHVTQLDQRFRAALAGGVVDLYLPNDTHCGYVGYQIAADAVLDVLQRRNLLDPEFDDRWFVSRASIDSRGVTPPRLTLHREK
jgi:hypothetical protein